MDIQGGDEVSALVFDIGTSTMKVGFAGDDSPNSIIPTRVGVSSGKKEMMEDEEETNTSQRTNFYVGRKSLNFVRDFMEMEQPIKNGKVNDWDHIERLINYAEKERLNILPSEYPVVMGEVPFVDSKDREKMAEIMFEQFNHPAFFLCKNPVLTAFSCGKATSLVVESGAGVSCCSPVYDGYVLRRGVSYNFFAGDELDTEILKFYAKQNVVFRPHFVFEKRVIDNQLQNVEVERPNVTSSYRDWSIRSIIKDLKKDMFFVSENPLDLSRHVTIPPQAYSLPDGTRIQLSEERCKITELFFHPSALRNSPPLSESVNQSQVKTESSKKALHELATESIHKCDVDLRKGFFNSIILSGGNTMIAGLAKRFEKEITAKTPISVRSGKTPIIQSLDRVNSVWVGGSILSSLGSFQQLWVSSDQYKENGSGAINKCCP